MVFRGYSISGPDDYYPDEGIFIYPNPAPGYLNIFIPGDPVCDRISIFNAGGQAMLQKDFHSSVTLDLSQLSEGVYHYNLYNGNTFIKAGSFIKK